VARGEGGREAVSACESSQSVGPMSLVSVKIDV
jgi:hypothetical protein